jgi:hypothetical protein
MRTAQLPRPNRVEETHDHSGRAFSLNYALAELIDHLGRRITSEPVSRTQHDVVVFAEFKLIELAIDL